jgi:hypothetical protein
VFDLDMEHLETRLLQLAMHDRLGFSKLESTRYNVPVGEETRVVRKLKDRVPVVPTSLPVQRVVVKPEVVPVVEHVTVPVVTPSPLPPKQVGPPPLKEESIETLESWLDDILG